MKDRIEKNTVFETTYQCKQFAAELMSRMTAQGMKGEMVVLKSDTGFI